MQFIDTSPDDFADEIYVNLEYVAMVEVVDGGVRVLFSSGNYKNLDPHGGDTLLKAIEQSREEGTTSLKSDGESET